MTRLDTQRTPTRLHARTSKRLLARGYDGVPHSIWGDPLHITAVPSAAFTEETVTASDAPNAAKLAGLGYVASPTTNWTTGQRITVSGFNFNWSGSAWAAGIHT